MGEADKDCEKLSFMTEGDSRDSILRDLVMPDLLQQAFHEVGNITGEHPLFGTEQFSPATHEDHKAHVFQPTVQDVKLAMQLSESAELSLGLHDVSNLGAEPVVVDPGFVTSVASAKGSTFTPVDHNIAANFTNGGQEHARNNGAGASFHNKIDTPGACAPTEHLDKGGGTAPIRLSTNNGGCLLSEPYHAATTQNVLMQNVATISVAANQQILQLQQQQTCATSSSGPITVATTVVPTTLMASVANKAPKLGTYHNRNFVQTEAGVQPSVFLVPTVQSDGSVAYAFHQSPQVKIVSPLKGCSPLIPLVHLPATPTRAAMDGVRPLKPAKSVGKARQPPKILPKSTAALQPRLVSAGKVIRVATGQDDSSQGGLQLVTKQALCRLQNSDSRAFPGGGLHGDANRLVTVPLQCSDEKMNRAMMLQKPVAIPSPAATRPLFDTIHRNPQPVAVQQLPAILSQQKMPSPPRTAEPPVVRGGENSTKRREVATKSYSKEAVERQRAQEAKSMMNPAIRQLAVSQEPTEKRRKILIARKEVAVLTDCGKVQLQAELTPRPTSFAHKKPDDSFSVVAFLREAAKSQGAGGQRSRGRAKRGVPKLINQKKIFADMKKELGLREATVKEIGLIQADMEEEFVDDNTQDSTNTTEEYQEPEPQATLSRTRCGRPVRPPNRVPTSLEAAIHPPEHIKMGEDATECARKFDISFASPPPPPFGGGKGTYSTATKVNAEQRPLGIRPEQKKFKCEVCGKLYLGKKKMARHLKIYPDHSFSSPLPPQPSPTPHPPARNTTHSNHLETWLANTEASAVLDLVGPKLLHSFSLWDLLVRKVSYSRLGTVDILASLFADIQALVMDLKNLAEQCLTSQRPHNGDSSCSVTLSPMMSSILGQSRNGGGVERFVLPYNQIPTHYHKLLGFSTGLRQQPQQQHVVTATTTTMTSSAPAAAATTLAGGELLSPDSTNSIFQPEEDNMSQMSLSSDILDRPLGDKVVLEENLGTRKQRPDLDEEETQDSSIADHHHRDQTDDDEDGDDGGRQSAKRARIDSESQSSPPHFLHEESSNVSNLSSTSNMGLKEDEEEEEEEDDEEDMDSHHLSRTHHRHRHHPEEGGKSDSNCSGLGKGAENSIDNRSKIVRNNSTVPNGDIMFGGNGAGGAGCAVPGDSALARLPSFSSIINGGSPKVLEVDDSQGGGGETACDPHCMQSRGESGGGSGDIPLATSVGCSQEQNNIPPPPCSNSLLNSTQPLKANGMLHEQTNNHHDLHLSTPMVVSGHCAVMSSTKLVENSTESGNLVSFQRRSSMVMSTAGMLNQLCENSTPESIDQHTCVSLFSSSNGGRLHGATGVDLAESSGGNAIVIEENGRQRQARHQHPFSRGKRGSDLAHNNGESGRRASLNASSASVTLPNIVTSLFQHACDNAVFNVTSSILYTGGNMAQNNGAAHQNGARSSFVEADATAVINTPKGEPDAPFHNGSGLGHIYQDSGRVKSSSPGKGLPITGTKRLPLLPPLQTDSADQDRSASPFLIKSPASPLSGGNFRRSQAVSHHHHRLQDFNSSTHVTYSGELYHPIPSVSPVKDFVDCGIGGGAKRLRQTPPTSQSPNLFNDLESVLGEEFAFHSALVGSVENVPAKTPEKLLASVPPSIIMINKKPTLGFEDAFPGYVEKEARQPPSNAGEEKSNTGISAFDVTCHENML